MILIRCDSSHKIGTGHVIRCLALAELLNKQGHNVEFVCRNEEGHISAHIQSQGFGVHLIEVSTLEDEIQIIKTLAPKGSWLVVDHYGLDAHFEGALSEQFRLFVIDDLANRKHSCEFLLDANVVSGKPSYKAWVPESTAQLLGPGYALLRSEFRKAIHWVPAYQERNGRVLVFFGGSDESGETIRFLEALRLDPSPTQFDILVSKHHRHLSKLQEMDMGAKARLHISPEKVSELMLQSSLYFGSGGTVTWERMALGLPGLVTSVADNQMEIAENLAHESQQIYLGPCLQVNYADAIQRIVQVLEDSSWCEQTSVKNRKLVRPLPASVVKAIFTLPEEGLRIRLATLADAKAVFEMRNDPTTRQMSLQSDELKWEEHEAWFRRALGTVGQRIYIGELQGQVCGQFRVNANLETSVMIAPAFRGQSLSSPLIRLGSQLYIEEFASQSPVLKASIKVENTASRKAFEKSGYIWKSREGDKVSALDLFLFNV